jgi:AhpD family alkylhydroperoxidase
MPTPYRYTTPIKKQAATGQVAAVYAQMATDFVLTDGPLMSLSPAPDLLAATWALLREAQLAGRAPRISTEVVAAAVSVANRCPFCVDAHTALIHATGAHQLAEAVWRGEPPADAEHARLVAWAMATTRPGAVELRTPPFPAELAAEYLGTALVTHFITRMVSALLNEQLLPAALQSSPLFRRLAGMLLARRARRPLPAGRSLPLLAGSATGAPPAWAGDTPIGAAYAALRAAAATGRTLLSRPARALIVATVDGWDGVHPPLTSAWLTEPLATLPDADRPGAGLALLAALAPYRITDADVAAWRTIHPSDADLVRLLAFGAMTAVDRIERWVASTCFRPHAARTRPVAAPARRGHDPGAG